MRFVHRRGSASFIAKDGLTLFRIYTHRNEFRIGIGGSREFNDAWLGLGWFSLEVQW